MLEKSEDLKSMIYISTLNIKKEQIKPDVCRRKEIIKDRKQQYTKQRSKRKLTCQKLVLRKH